VSAIAELREDRVVEGVYAVAKKERRRTRTGSDYLALELVDKSGRIEARVWTDVELLDGRFGEGDAVRVLGRVDKYQDRLQVAVRSLEPAEEDVTALTPGLRRDVDELDGFLEFIAGEISHPGLNELVGRFLGDELFRSRLRELPASPDVHHDYAGGLLEHTVAVTTICRDAAQVHPRLRSDLLVASALLHDAGRTVELGRAPNFRPTDEGRLLGHVQLGIRLIESRAETLDRAVLAELVHAVAVHHDARAARTAEAAVLYHANQLDAVAATRPVPES
jgi:3'-5' exoribonuclease